MAEDDRETDDFLQPSDIAQVVQFSLCRQFTDVHFRDYEKNQTDDFPVSRGKLRHIGSPAPVMATLGEEYEKELYDVIVEKAERVLSWDEEYAGVDVESEMTASEGLLSTLEASDRGKLDGPAVLLQPSFGAWIGNHRVAGDADLVVVWPPADDSEVSDIRAYDIKAGEEKPHHQVQATLYALMIEDILQDSDVDHELTAGIIDGETELEEFTPEGLPSFQYESRGEDIRRMLRGDGFLDRVFDREETPPHELGQAAKESGYSEIYYVQAIEERDIRLLELSEAAQDAYRDRGLETLEDIAELIEMPSSPRPYDDLPEVKTPHVETVRALNTDTRVDERVQVTAQRAQVLLGQLRRSHPSARDDAILDGAWLQGTGEADLPDDDPYWELSVDVEPGSMVRVYFDVHSDYLNDRVLLCSAAVDSTLRDGDPVVVSRIVDRVPGHSDDFDDAEGDLIDSFVDDVFDAVQQVADETPADEVPYHFYFHDEAERNRFVDALDRHVERGSVGVLRDLFDLRSAVHEDSGDGVEQRMVSYISEAVNDHYALSEPGLGIPHLHDQLKWRNLEFWRYTRESEDVTVNLREAFRYQCMTRSSAYTLDETGCVVIEPDADNPEGFYPTLPRDQTQIPLEYFWAVDGIESPHDDWVDGENIPVGNYRTANGDVRLVREDIEALGRRFALALCEIERELDMCRTDIGDERMQKSSLPVRPERIAERLDDAFDTQTLATGCREYLDLEHRAEVDELESLREQPIRQRVETGRALPIRITGFGGEAEQHDVEAELAYDAVGFGNGELLLQACRLGERDTVISSGIKDAGGMYVIDEDTWKRGKALPFDIESVDPEDDVPIKLSEVWSDSGNDDDPYEGWSPDPAYGEPPGKFEVRVDIGDELLLDEKQVTKFSTRYRRTLDGVSGHSVYQLFDSLRNGTCDPSALTIDAFDKARVGDFLDQLDTAVEAADEGEDVVSPNSRQRALIEKVEPRVSLLQGPPGTGKTKGALAPYLLSRLHDRLANNGNFCGLVTAPTNTAIGEVMEEVADLLQWCQERDVGDLSDASLYRVGGSVPDEDDRVEGVEYVNYNNEASMAEFQNVWSAFDEADPQQMLGDFGGNAAVVFATPYGMYRLMESLYVETGEYEDVTEVYDGALPVFDAVAIDEASMLRLPQLFTATPCVKETAQLVIAGDHRQMPPVQQHDWSSEDRRRTVDELPFLSGLNYARFLRGESVERIERNERLDVTSPDADIEFTRLQQTYRCHRTVAEFLRQWMYKQDGIEYQSNVDATMSVTESVPKGLAPVFGESPLVLITHDDRDAQQRNPSEVELASRIADQLPTSDDDDGIGIVTPHNAQKAMLRQNIDDDSVDVDTVERFQGGECEAVIISATVSDPAYLDAESDFIMNPNRLNVALSRMKKKLVVIAPESLFRQIPSDTDTYEDAQIWKGLYQTVADGQPDTTGEVIGEDTQFEVYTFDGD